MSPTTKTITNGNAEDAVRWISTIDGVFAVKSAYKKLTEGKYLHHEAMNVIPNDIWKALWRIQTPYMIKLLIWKCLIGIAQTNDKVSIFNNNVPEHCNICNEHVETLFHLLVHARMVWRSLNINIDNVAEKCSNIKVWIISWFNNLNHNGAEESNTWRLTLMVGCWVICKERCEKIFQNKHINHMSIVMRIQFHLQNFNHSAKDGAPGLPQNTLDNISVSAISKVFVDASFGRLTNSSGTRMMLLSDAGLYEGAKGSYADGVLHAEGAECMEILEALSWIKALNINEVQVIEDAEVVVNYIVTNNMEVRWENYNLITRIKTLISSFKVCKISRIKRDYNNITYCVARKVRKDKLLLEEYNDFSPWINSLLNRLAIPETV